MANPFRVRSDEESTHLHMRSSTFWMRLRANVRVTYRIMLVVLCGLSIVPMLTLAALRLSWVSWNTSLLIAGLIAAFVLLPIAVAFAVKIIVTSLRPSPLECMFPTRISFYPERIDVQPREGPERTEPYSWLAGAERTSRGILLSLTHDAKLQLEVDDAVVGAATTRRLEGWLRANGVLR